MNPCDSSSLLRLPREGGDTFSWERTLYAQGCQLVAGLDEAGRGPLAGPVVAACVILSPQEPTDIFRDSKQLTARQRERLQAILAASKAVYGIGLASPREIETINILQASLLAMQRALAQCAAANGGRTPDYLLIDGRNTLPISLAQQALVKGESKSASIAAASILAKVTRDQLMAKAHLRYPQYGFHRHQGYPTKAHRQAIAQFGPCPLHRRTFRGVVEYLPVAQSLPECGG